MHPTVHLSCATPIPQYVFQSEFEHNAIMTTWISATADLTAAPSRDAPC